MDIDNLIQRIHEVGAKRLIKQATGDVDQSRAFVSEVLVPLVDMNASPEKKMEYITQLVELDKKLMLFQASIEWILTGCEAFIEQQGDDDGDA